MAHSLPQVNHATNGSDDLHSTVVKGGYCVGCGVCASVPGSPYSMVFTPQGSYQPEPARLHPSTSEGAAIAHATCPFSNAGQNETEIANNLFGHAAAVASEGAGLYINAYAGHVQTGHFRERGSSGGIASWLQHQLFTCGLVDAMLHVREGSPGGRMFEYAVARSCEDLELGSKSRYYPVEMSAVLSHVREHDMRYALIGLPCFIKAVRRLAFHDPVIRSRIVYMLGLVCGHLKSSHYANLLAWDAGIHPSSLRSINFRRKNPSMPPNQYLVACRHIGPDGNEYVHNPTTVSPYSDWGLGLMKLKACDYCDDVFAETADVVIGDAWLPRFMTDHRGTNLVLTRSAALDAIISNGIRSGELALTPLTENEVLQSQDAGLRHRRDGLRYRLYLAGRRGDWVPTKRLAPSWKHLSARVRFRLRLREELRDVSHQAFAEALARNSLQYFHDRLRPLLTLYRLSYVSFRRLALSPLKLISRASR